MTEEINYCKNCKYIKIGFLEKILMDYEFAKCLAFPDMKTICSRGLVDGKKIEMSRYCDLIRLVEYQNRKICPKYEEK